MAITTKGEAVVLKPRRTDTGCFVTLELPSPEDLEIFFLLNKQYIWLSLLAYSLAIPFSWYVMEKWLSDFTFKIEMSWTLFGLAIAGGLLIALATVSYHAIRAATINPAETLKYE